MVLVMVLVYQGTPIKERSTKVVRSLPMFYEFLSTFQDIF
jgi:hypothetical protein